MARFTGDGALTVAGSDTRVFDCEFENAGSVADGLIVNGTNALVANCRFIGMEVGVDINNPGAVVASCFFSVLRIGVNVDANNALITGNTISVTAPDPLGQGVLLNAGNGSRVIGNHITVVTAAYGIEGGSPGQVIANNVISVTGTQSGIFAYERGIVANNDINGNQLSDGVRVGGFASQVSVVGNRIHLPFHGISFVGSAGNGNQVLDNEIFFPEGHGIDASNGTDGIQIAGNRIEEPGQDADNTYDGIAASGDRVRIMDNIVIGDDAAPQPRFGISVSGDCNVVVGNDLGNRADYGTDALNDAGTNTQLTYPSDPTYGANFTACGSPASPSSP